MRGGPKRAPRAGAIALRRGDVSNTIALCMSLALHGGLAASPWVERWTRTLPAGQRVLDLA